MTATTPRSIPQIDIDFRSRREVVQDATLASMTTNGRVLKMLLILALPVSAVASLALYRAAAPRILSYLDESPPTVIPHRTTVIPAQIDVRPSSAPGMTPASPPRMTPAPAPLSPLPPGSNPPPGIPAMPGGATTTNPAAYLIPSSPKTAPPPKESVELTASYIPAKEPKGTWTNPKPAPTPAPSTRLAPVVYQQFFDRCGNAYYVPVVR